MRDKVEDKLPCENCICLAICKDLYNGLLHAYLVETKRHPDNFKIGVLAKARIHLANKCSLMDKYLYGPEIDGVENLKREKNHHCYFVQNDLTLRYEFPCR